MTSYSFSTALLLAFLADSTLNFSWTWSTMIAAVALIVAILGHVVSGVYFLIKFSSLVAVMDSRLTMLTKDVTEWRGEVKSDMAEIKTDLNRLGDTREDVAAIRAHLEGLDRRVRGLEDAVRQGAGSHS